MELDVLLRHVLRLTRDPVCRRAADPPALAVALRDNQHYTRGEESRFALRRRNDWQDTGHGMSRDEAHRRTAQSPLDRNRCPA
jgi:hypothetical protein